MQELSDGFDDVEVNISLPAQERDSLTSLYGLDIVLPGGGTELLQNLAWITSERGFENLRHSNGRLAVTVIGSVDPAVNNTNDIRANLEAQLLPRLSSELGVSFSFEGRQADQSETLGDMANALIDCRLVKQELGILVNLLRSIPVHLRTALRARRPRDEWSRSGMQSRHDWPR